MERTEWLSLKPADARFLMLTAITHHTFSSPAWGEPRSVSSMPNSPSSTGWPPRPSSITTWPDPRRGGPSAHFCELLLAVGIDRKLTGHRGAAARRAVYGECPA